MIEADALWPPTREHALQRLEAFVANAGHLYAKQRNFDFGPTKHDKVSRLSPWLRHRVINEQEVLSATLKKHTEAQAEKFIQEVFWRGYFKGWLEHRPDVWRYYRSDLVALIDRLEKEAGLAHDYETAISGKTGIACFDAWAKELIETGYLHNHARMWFASIWIFTLKLPWQLGADFFYRHLLDGDPASNTCSWRWVGGLHTLGKTYLARADNIDKFTAGRFSPKGQLADTAAAIEDARPIQIYPPKFNNTELDRRRFGLLVTEEDCHPESLDIPDPYSILILPTASPRSVLPLGAHDAEFAPNVLKASQSRIEKHFEVVSEMSDEIEWSTVIADWMLRHDLEVCVTSHLPLGPVAKRLRSAVRASGVEMIERPRPYDQVTWPHAKKGFFGLKKKIPSILAELGLSERA